MGVQFRSRFLFILSKFDLIKSLEQHHNKVHQEKGLMDGVGGTVKNLLLRLVKSK